MENRRCLESTDISTAQVELKCAGRRIGRAGGETGFWGLASNKGAKRIRVGREEAMMSSSSGEPGRELLEGSKKENQIMGWGCDVRGQIKES